MDTADIAIIGAGVVGLAIAAELAAAFPDRAVVLLERHHAFGQETSSRNSEVIHAGMYYPTGSLKARLCVEGKQRLYDFCTQWQVPFKRCGKLIVATTEEDVATLESLVTQGRKNGVEDLLLLDASQAARYEPHVRAAAAVFSPSTGIVDVHQLMARLEWLASQRKAALAYRHEITGILPGRYAHTLCYRSPRGHQEKLKAAWIVNSAGLACDYIASLAGIDIDRAGYRLHFCKGEYFRISAAKAHRIARLIYPPPYEDLRGLGIHVTIMLDGMVKLGPNAFYVDEIDYRVDPQHAADFYTCVKDYLPFLEPDDLLPDTAGIRPKLQAPGTPMHDFIVCHETQRGLDGIINLIGIESPGLTACLSLAHMVKDIIVKNG